MSNTSIMSIVYFIFKTITSEFKTVIYRFFKTSRDRELYRSNIFNNQLNPLITKVILLFPF